MTDIQILTKIWNMYVDHSYRQREIAEHLKVSTADIGYILRMLGFHRCKMVQITPTNIVLRDPHAKFIISKISEILSKKEDHYEKGTDFNGDSDLRR